MDLHIGLSTYKGSSVSCQSTCVASYIFIYLHISLSAYRGISVSWQSTCMALWILLTQSTLVIPVNFFLSSSVEECYRTR